MLLRKYRIDYFLIWGHGIPYASEIVAQIRAHRDLNIIMIRKHNTKSIRRLVKKIYSYDYAPFIHLKQKTKYLLNTSKEVLFILVKNVNPREVIVGEGDFQHVESSTVKHIKEKLRDQYNEKNEDKRTENHVIHASDNEDQVDHVLKYLGYYNGIKHFQDESEVDAPWHLSNLNNYTIKRIDLEQTHCNIIENGELKKNRIEQTPHYKYLCGEINVYRQYLKNHLGKQLTDDYSTSKFDKLFRIFSEEKPVTLIPKIICREEKSGQYTILDGVHRACIARYIGHDYINSVVVQ